MLRWHSRRYQTKQSDSVATRAAAMSTSDRAAVMGRVRVQQGRGTVSMVFPMKAVMLIILIDLIIAAWIFGSSANLDWLRGINPYPIPACYSGPTRCLR